MIYIDKKTTIVREIQRIKNQYIENCVEGSRKITGFRTKKGFLFGTLDATESDVYCPSCEEADRDGKLIRKEIELSYEIVKEYYKKKFFKKGYELKSRKKQGEKTEKIIYCDKCKKVYELLPSWSSAPML